MVYLTHGRRQQHFYQLNGCWRVGQWKAWRALCLRGNVLPHLTLPTPTMCSDDAIQPHPSSSPRLAGALFGIISESFHCTRLSLGLWLWPHYVCWVWVFRILWRICFSTASMPAGQPRPTKTGELAAAYLIGFLKNRRSCVSPAQGQVQIKCSVILVKFNSKLLHRENVPYSLTFSS